jgi:FkbM family methyltransferase
VYLAYKQLIEAGPVAQLQSFVVPGSTVIDVGANIGFFTLRFGRWVGPSGRVVAIEPEGRNMATLRRRVDRAGLEGVVECVQAAATDRAGEARLALNPVHPGDHRLAEEGQPVHAITLDELMAGDPRKVTLIKADVQGAEMLVLTGAREVIERHRPAIFVEVDDEALRQFGSSSAELIETVENFGYTTHALTRRGIKETEARQVKAQAGDGYLDLLLLPGARQPDVSAERTREAH